MYGQLALVVDERGIAHAASPLRNGIYYLTNETGSWTRARISHASRDGSDGEPAIAIDDDGSLAVAFTRYSDWHCELVCEPGSSAGVFVATRHDGRWSEPEATGPPGASEPAVAVHGGRLHLAYRVLGEGDFVEYAAGAGDNWTVRLTEQGAWSPSLAAGADGRVHIVLASEAGIVYVTETRDAQLERTLLAGSERERPLLLLDDGGGPTVLFMNYQRPTGTFVTRLDDGRWSEPRLLLPNAYVYEAARDAGGDIHMVFQGSEEFDGLWYARWADGMPERRLLDATTRTLPDGPTSPSTIAVDSRGRPHVLFMVGYGGRDYVDDVEDVSENGLWYAVGPEASR